MNKVKFYLATSEQFAALEAKDDAALYFLTDTGEIFKGNTRFTFPVRIVDSFPDGGECGILYFQPAGREVKIWNENSWSTVVSPQVTEITDLATDEQTPTAKAVQNALYNVSSVTAFAVFPTDFVIPAGAVSEMEQGIRDKLASVYGDWVLSESIESVIPAAMTHTFTLRTIQDTVACDVVIDWGDGQIDVLKTFEFDENTQTVEHGRTVIHKNFIPDYGENRLGIRHTYEVSGKFLVRIFGKDYFGIQNFRPGGNSGVSPAPADWGNCVCECCGGNTPIAPHITNGAMMFGCCPKLLKIEGAYAYPLKNFRNCCEMFEGSSNLLYFNNVTFESVVGAFHNYALAYCPALKSVTFSLPKITGESGFQCILAGDKKLAMDIAYLISGKFLSRKINMESAFLNCSCLTGTVPADFLWNDHTVEWVIPVSNDSNGSNKKGPFYGCSAEIRAQVPFLWGGTNSEITISESVGSTNWQTIE